MPQTVYLFVDTNLFLQCRALHDLPWRDLARGQLATESAPAPEHIELLVIDAVQSEIDRLKGDGAGRRARRARAAASLFREAIRHYPEPVTVIRDADPRVTLTFPRPPPAGHSATPVLESKRTDDRIVEQALAFRSARPCDEPAPDARILTHDGGVMLTATRHGAPYIEIPEDWLLSPEADGQEKRISALERQLAKLQANGPLLLLEVANAHGSVVSEGIEREIVTFLALTDGEINALEAAILAAHPMVKSFDAPASSVLAAASMTWQPPAEKEIRSYHDEHAQWRGGLRARISAFPDQLNARSRIVELTVTLRNDGTRPADRVLVEFTAQGAVLLAVPGDPDDDGANSTVPRLIVPSPPAPPEGKYAHRMLADIARLSALDPFRVTVPRFEMPEMARLRPPPRRDRHLFYWKPHRPARVTDSWIFECEEFRHGLDPEEFEIRLLVTSSANANCTEACSGNLRCRVSASNAAEPITRNVPITVRLREESSFPLARQWQRAAPRPQAN